MSKPNKPPENPPPRCSPQLEQNLTAMAHLLSNFNPEDMGFVLVCFDKSSPIRVQAVANVPPQAAFAAMRCWTQANERAATQS